MKIRRTEITFSPERSQASKVEFDVSPRLSQLIWCDELSSLADESLL